MVVRLAVAGRNRVVRRYVLTSVVADGRVARPRTSSANRRPSSVRVSRSSGSYGRRVLTVLPRGPRVLTSTQHSAEST